MDSIGETLKNQRTNRGLSLQEVNDATRITVQNLSALEENRFDYFPNRVYARAFLRDYANFLGLDSAALLARYESGLDSSEPEAEVAPVKSGGSAVKTIVYALVGLLVLAALAAALYYGSSYDKKRHAAPKVVAQSSDAEDGQVATLPKPAGVKPVDEEPEPPAAETPKPAPVTDKVVVSVTAIEDVWVGVTADDKSVFGNTIPKGATKTFEASKSVRIRAGKAGAVQVRLNGNPQPSLGPMQVVGTKTYTIDEVKAQAGGAAVPNPPAPAVGGPVR